MRALPKIVQISRRWLPHSRAGTCLPRYKGRTFTGTWEQFWPDVLPAAISDSYGYQWKLNSGSLDASPSPEPRLVLNEVLADGENSLPISATISPRCQYWTDKQEGSRQTDRW